MLPTRIEPTQAALLLVDLQEKLLPAMPEGDARRLLACAELLAEAARLFRIPTVVTEQHPRGLGPTVPSLRALLEGVEPRALVAEKTVFNALGSVEVARALANRRPRTVVVAGVEAHVCVLQTVRELLERGFQVLLPFDAVASRDPRSRDVALGLMERLGAAVTTTESVVFDLLGDAKNEHFKALSARVKALPLR